MTPRPTTAQSKLRPPAREEPPGAERCLTLMIEGAAQNLPEIDGEAYGAFRAVVGRMAMQVPDRLPPADKLVIIRAIIHEFEAYRANVELTLRDRQGGWRALAEVLLEELLTSLGVDKKTSSFAASLSEKVPALATAEDLREYRTLLGEFLHPCGGSGEMEISPLMVADRSTANDNAAGLRGGGSAVAHMKEIMEHGSRGFVVLFRLGCLEMISERFGWNAVEDCLMTVSAFLTHSLQREDVIYHWSDSSLLAILQGRVNEQIVAAELSRIASHNRDITIQIDGRTIMLRVPVDFNITPISRLRAADDLYKLSFEHAATR